jgi:hypothetical protein
MIKVKLRTLAVCGNLLTYPQFRRLRPRLTVSGTYRSERLLKPSTEPLPGTPPILQSQIAMAKQRYQNRSTAATVNGTPVTLKYARLSNSKGCHADCGRRSEAAALPRLEYNLL